MASTMSATVVGSPAHAGRRTTFELTFALPMPSNTVRGPKSKRKVVKSSRQAPTPTVKKSRPQSREQKPGHTKTGENTT